MKKITNFLMMLVVALIYAQPNDNASAPPVRDAENVISIFSGEYADISGVNYNPNWGQTGFNSANTSFDPGTGDIVLAYPNFNYQGVDFGSAQNISGMDFLHVDIWIDGTFDPNVYVISSGAEIAHSISNTGSDSWISVDIPVPGITGDLTNAIQFKFDNGNGSSDAIYVDNLYFWKEVVDPVEDATLTDLQVDGSTVSGFASSTTAYNVPVPSSSSSIPQITSAVTTNTNATTAITQATEVPGNATVVVTAEDGVTTKNYTISYFFKGPSSAAPTPPVRDNSSVISFYSDAYSQQALNFDVDFCGTGSTEEVQIDGNNTILYKGNNCQGIQLDSPVDASSFTNLHFDFYVDDAQESLVGTVISLKFNQTNGEGPGDDIFLDYVLTTATSPAIVKGQWVSVDATVDLSNFDALDEFVITAGTLGNNLYYDNLYLYGGTLSNDSFTQAEFKVYPNPSKDDWNIRTTENIKNVQVYNITGRLVRDLQVNGSEAVINTNGLSSGVYLAKVSNDLDQTKTIKLIKE
ncbi:MAG: T9SS type A sorting domain-containing protein [Psychroflexus sp.]